MKTNSFKATLILAGMILLNLNVAVAGVGDKLNKLVNGDTNSYQGLYIILGVVGASLITYLIVNHYNNKEEEKEQRTHGGIHHHHHRRHHHHHRVIKKTS